jgi:hypothetical protein
MMTNTPFAQCHIVSGKSGKSLTNALCGLMFVTFLVVLSSANAQAQTTSSICRQNGFQENSADFNGIWELGFSTGTTRYVARLLIKGNAGVSVTQYYDERLSRKRRIKQVLVLCQSTVGVAILGFRPTDMDTDQTGGNLTYSADNFVISRQPDGTVAAFNRDDAGTLAEVNIKFIKELDR